MLLDTSLSFIINVVLFLSIERSASARVFFFYAFFLVELQQAYLSRDLMILILGPFLVKAAVGFAILKWLFFYEH